MKHYYKSAVIVDNNVLNDFYEISRLDLLFDIFSTVGIPKSIFDRELPNDIKDKLNNYKYELYSMNTVKAFETYSILTETSKYRRLSACDKITISIAKQFDFYCNTNDGLVKKACIELDVECVGTLGIVGCAFSVGIINKKELMEITTLLLGDSTSCYLKPNIVNEFLDELGIEFENLDIIT